MAADTTPATTSDTGAATAPHDDAGAPLRLRCWCLRIHAADDLRLEEGEVGAPGPGEVRLRVGFGGICGSDLHYFKAGGFGSIRLQEPMVLGHEVAGTVEALGEGVDGLAIGDRVAMNPSRPCWRCRYCLDGAPNQCLDMRYYGSAMRLPHLQGAFQDRLVCRAEQCHRVAAGVPTAHAALAEPLAVALHAASRPGPLLGRRVLVSGCGPIGVLVAAAARLAGAAEVVATDVVDEPLAIVRRMGATQAVNAASARDWVAAQSAGKGSFDVLFECSGNAQALLDGLAMVRARGTVVQLGMGGDVPLPQTTVVTKELTLMGSFRFHAEFALAVQLINDGRIDMAPMVTAAFPMDRAVEAFRLAADRRRAMKVLIDFGTEAAA